MGNQKYIRFSEFHKSVIKAALDNPNCLNDGDYDFVNDMAGRENLENISISQHDWLTNIGEKLYRADVQF